MRERRCIVRGEVMPDSGLIRFVVAPDGTLTPDLAATLPGRGIWLGADAASLATAVKKNLFARAAKAPVTVPADLAARIEMLLVSRMQADLGLARRSGQLLLGFDTVLKAIQSDNPPQVLVEASDGAADGKRKLFGAAHARGLKIEVIECLTTSEISLAVGRENVIHAALKSGRLQERLSTDAIRLSGFRSVPAVSHESDE
ncbi:MAG: RNA-binding protein [Proteobacteria bacterium]|nr:RNA-binding protein [Pseudomonadota bacterium]